MRRSFASYQLLVRWEYLRFRSQIPLIIAIQVLLGMGIVFGFSLLLGHVDPLTALFFTTGAPTLGLLLLGLNIVPQEVSQAKLTGRYEYIASLPVPRLSALAATVSFWIVMQLPGTAMTLFLARLRFHVHLHLGLAAFPAVVLVALTGASVGYALASVLKPNVANQVGSFVSILLLLFSPVNFPASRMPAALQAVHRFLPVEYMADVVRGSLTGHYDTSAPLAFAVVTIWCVVGLSASYAVAIRRR